MKVILIKDVDKIADKNDIIDVSEGYARNYLFPNKLAVLATDSAVKELEKKNAVNERKLSSQKGELEKLAKKLGAMNFEIMVDAGDGGKLFGSVTSKDICAAVRANAGIELDKKKVVLAEPLRLVGDYQVPVKLFAEIEAVLKITLSPTKQ